MDNTTPEFLFHGSSNKIQGCINIMPSSIDGGKKPITAVFATSSFDIARMYACYKIIGKKGTMSKICGQYTLCVQELSTDFARKAYIYKLNSDGFVCDDTAYYSSPYYHDYYSVENVNIQGVIEFDVMNEIQKGHVQVYVLKPELNHENLSEEEFRQLCKKTVREHNFNLYVPCMKNTNTIKGILKDCFPNLIKYINSSCSR